LALDVLTEIEIAARATPSRRTRPTSNNTTAWYEKIKSVEWKTPPPFAVGSRVAFVAVFLGRRLAYIYKITDLVPGERLVMSKPPKARSRCRQPIHGQTPRTVRPR
jgi:hypothetical protein